VRSRRSSRSLTLIAMACLVLASVVAAQDRLPRLPAGAALPQSADSPGPVTFNHASHVKPATPNCTGCHPRVFKILKPVATRSGKPITHEMMNAGEACGSCHGKKAFGFDDCTTCHHGG
jgi:c(7)-type cytochrome triheme protein